MQLDLHGGFSGKTIFFTGVTGFVGKVFLYLLLKNFPDLKRIYVLVRTKKGQQPQDRFASEVLASKCFLPLKEAVGEAEFKRRISLVQAVSGDIMEDFLGINRHVYTEMCENVNFIAHIAATVDFQEKLNVSVQMNTLGSLRVLALAHKCKHLEAMVHTSTCYVNWARSGRDNPVKEQIYPLPFDPEAMCKHILSMHDSAVPRETKRLLEMYNFPNTYTFTKSMGEQLLRNNKGRLPLTIVRPSIIGCSYRDPYPGWVDALTAAGGLFLTVGLGIVSEMQLQPENIADLVPVDHVCSTIIKALFKTALHYKTVNQASGAVPPAPQAVPASPLSDKTALLVGGKHPIAPFNAAVTSVSTMNVVNQGATASSQQALLNMATGGAKAESVTSEAVSTFPFVFHSATSSCLNRLTWSLARDVVVHFWNTGKRHPRAVKGANMYMTPNPVFFWTMLSLRSILPFVAMKVVASLPPPIGSESKRKMVQKYEKALNRAADLRFQFSPFVVYEWIYEIQNSKVLDEGLSPKALADFPTDPFLINWWTYVQLYNYGICKYIINSVDGRSQPIIPRSGAEAFMKASL